MNIATTGSNGWCGPAASEWFLPGWRRVTSGFRGPAPDDEPAPSHGRSLCCPGQLADRQVITSDLAYVCLYQLRIVNRVTLPIPQPAAVNFKRHCSATKAGFAQLALQHALLQ